jgi:hypothetical protein
VDFVIMVSGIQRNELTRIAAQSFPDGPVGWVERSETHQQLRVHHD